MSRLTAWAPTVFILLAIPGGNAMAQFNVIGPGSTPQGDFLRGVGVSVYPRYAALASHYAFEAKFCLPAQAHEKPDAESGVRAVQRRFATPVPRVAGITELNEHMRTRCLDERRRTVRSASGAFVIGDRLAEELAAAARLPPRAFDPCIERQAVADKYQTVAFDAKPTATACRGPGRSGP